VAGVWAKPAVAICELCIDCDKLTVDTYAALHHIKAHDCCYVRTPMLQHRPAQRGCLWPMWAHDAEPNHKYCGCERVPGSSYCAKHRKLSIRDLQLEPRQVFVPRKAA